jgi:uncharacterized membrane protein
MRECRLNLQEGQRSGSRVLRMMKARPQLTLCVVIGVVVGMVFPASLVPGWLTRTIIGWNVGAVLYLVIALRLMFRSSHEGMHQRAIGHDEGRAIILALVVAAALMTLGAIVAELGMGKDSEGGERYVHIGLAVLTLLSSWSFTQVMFAQHYAHDYYVAVRIHRDGGLDFPGDEEPDYGDFLYFSIVIGTSAQTADVGFTNRKQRRTGTVHCVLAFFFNTSLVALTINIVSGLF